MKKTIEAPPIWVWGISILLGIGLCAIQSISGKQAKIIDGIPDNLVQSTQSDSQFRILVLGSSVLKDALEDDEVAISEELSEKVGKKIIFASVSLPGKQLNDFFSDAHMLAAFLEFNPTHLIFGKNTLIIGSSNLEDKTKAPVDESKGFLDEINENRLSWLKFDELIKLSIVYHPITNSNRLDKWLNSVLTDSYNQPWSQKLDSLKIMNNSRCIKKTPFEKLILDGIEHFQRRNTSFICAEIPYSRAIEKGFENKIYIGEEQQAFNYLAEKFNMEIWEADQVYPFNHYKDFVHMNNLGRKKYTSYLVDRLSKYLLTQ
ncbi:MAG: hypothetical protein ACI85I_000819 [Arenicella sp.]|jgi:hypothetical protein